MREAVREMSRKGLGMTCVVVDGERLAGIITDGDMRRRMSASVDLLEPTGADVMTPTRRRSRGNAPREVLHVLEQRKITPLVVVSRRPACRRDRAPARPMAHPDVLPPSHGGGPARAPQPGG